MFLFFFVDSFGFFLIKNMGFFKLKNVWYLFVIKDGKLRVKIT
jgi:hypothetical protein